MWKLIKGLFDWLGAGRAKGEGVRIKNKVPGNNQNWALNHAMLGRRVCRIKWPMDEYVEWDKYAKSFFKSNMTNNHVGVIYLPEYDPEGSSATDWVLWEPPK